MKKKKYQRALMELVTLSDADLDSVSGGVANTEEENQKKKKKDGTQPGQQEETEGFFSAGSVGMCSGYEQQASFEQSSDAQNQANQTENTENGNDGTPPAKDEMEDFFSAGFMGMCSGYEQQGNLVQHGEDKEDDMEDDIREDCFAYGFMGMCSGYE